MVSQISRISARQCLVLFSPFHSEALMDDRGQSSIEALVVVAIMLHITLWFVVQLVMALYSAGLEMGVDSLDVSAAYGINGVGVEGVNRSIAAKKLGHRIAEIKLPLIPMVIHESTSTAASDTTVPSGTNATSVVDRTGVVDGKGNRMVRWMPAWQLQVNQCILEVYGRMASGELNGIDEGRIGSNGGGDDDADAAEKEKSGRTKKKK